MKNILLNKGLMLLLSTTLCVQTTYTQIDSISNELMFLQESESDKSPHELSVWMQGGTSTLYNRSRIANINQGNVGFGGALGVGYTYFINSNWGLSSGVEFACYREDIRLNGLTSSYNTNDIFGNPIVYNAVVNNYREKQRAGMVSIPLSVLYQFGNNNVFYVSTGIKIGLPVYERYQGGRVTLTASGYYPNYDQTEIWQNDLGYGNFQSAPKQQDLNLKTSFMGMLEGGMIWDMNIGTRLYAGVYIDCGFNNLLRSGKRQFVEYNHGTPSKPLINGAMTLSDKISSLSFGIKLKLAFHAFNNNVRNLRIVNCTVGSCDIGMYKYQDFTEQMSDAILIDTDTIQAISTDKKNR